jgi:hypothetical protein
MKTAPNGLGAISAKPTSGPWSHGPADFEFPRTRNQQLTGICADLYNPVFTRVPAHFAFCQLIQYKPPLGTILGTLRLIGPSR